MQHSHWLWTGPARGRPLNRPTTRPCGSENNEIEGEKNKESAAIQKHECQSIDGLSATQKIGKLAKWWLGREYQHQEHPEEINHMLPDYMWLALTTEL